MKKAYATINSVRKDGNNRIEYDKRNVIYKIYALK